jgi:hypothetical protein
MKAKRIGYWVCMILMVFFFLPGGVMYVLRSQAAVHAVRVLGFPMYFCVFLGVWKVLGSMALVVPRFALLKEWAYDGGGCRGLGYGRGMVACCGSAEHPFHLVWVVGAAAGEPADKRRSVILAAQRRAVSRVPFC